ncbi:hypothetical protein RSAG8_13245, partial [Rhizoctonia solani AG-8 WAC10335]
MAVRKKIKQILKQSKVDFISLFKDKGISSFYFFHIHGRAGCEAHELMLKEIRVRTPRPVQHRIQTQEESRLAEPVDASNRKCDLPVLADTPPADSMPMAVTSIPESNSSLHYVAKLQKPP